MRLLDHHAPLKKKVLRANNAPYITKKLRKTIMKRSQLGKIYLKTLSEKSLKAYRRQKHYVSRLYKKETKIFFDSLNPSIISDNRKLWKNIKPLFSNKGNFGNKIKLVESGEIIDEDVDIAEELNKFFKNVVASLNIHENKHIVESIENINNPVDKAIKKFEFHPSILLIKNKIGEKVSPNLFSFSEVTKAEVLKEINIINNKKATPSSTMLPKILKISSECSADTFTSLVNKSLTSSGKFHSNLKLADITPTYKKKIPKPKKTIDQ